MHTYIFFLTLVPVVYGSDKVDKISCFSHYSSYFQFLSDLSLCRAVLPGIMFHAVSHVKQTILSERGTTAREITDMELFAFIAIGGNF